MITIHIPKEFWETKMFKCLPDKTKLLYLYRLCSPRITFFDTDRMYIEIYPDDVTLKLRCE